MHTRRADSRLVVRRCVTRKPKGRARARARFLSILGKSRIPRGRGGRRSAETKLETPTRNSTVGERFRTGKSRESAALRRNGQWFACIRGHMAIIRTRVIYSPGSREPREREGNPETRAAPAIFARCARPRARARTQIRTGNSKTAAPRHAAS